MVPFQARWGVAIQAVQTPSSKSCTSVCAAIELQGTCHGSSIFVDKMRHVVLTMRWALPCATLHHLQLQLCGVVRHFVKQHVKLCNQKINCSERNAP